MLLLTAPTNAGVCGKLQHCLPSGHLLTISCTTQGMPAAMAARSSCTAASSCAAGSASEVPGGGRCRNLQEECGRGRGGKATLRSVVQERCPTQCHIEERARATNGAAANKSAASQPGWRSCRHGISNRDN